MAGQRGKGNFILKIDTGSGTPTWTTLENLMSGVSFNKSRDSIETTSLSNTSNYKEYINGDADFEISGTFNITPSSPAQAKVIAAAAPGGTGTVKVQWAETLKVGDPLYTAEMILTTATTTIDDPMAFNFAFKLKGDITSSTQA